MADLNSQQRADIYLAHWWNLWPLPAEERRKRFAQIIADIEFEEELQLVTREMEAA